MTFRKGTRARWTKEELAILRDAWMRGMIAKSISSMILKHRTPGAIQRAMFLNGMKFNGNLDWIPQRSITIGVPGEMHEQLRSLAAEQGITIRRLCRTIIHKEVRNLHDTRAGPSAHRKEYMRKYLREYRARKRQKSSAKQASV
jgi:hypothetical protein